MMTRDKPDMKETAQWVQRAFANWKPLKVRFYLRTSEVKL